MSFLREFITNPVTTGSVAPSSRFLAQAIVDGLDLPAADAVLEYGPGTGVFTEFVVRGLRPNTKFAAIELNPHFAQTFRKRYPELLLFQDSVANVKTICDQAGIEQVDCIVSGLPWATFPESLQVQCLEEMMRVLKPGGQFVTFSYVHSQLLAGAKRFTKILPDYFSIVSNSPIVWLNVPPAFVYRCRR